MKFEVASSYNLDILCFMNVLTSDEFYVKHYREEYALFFNDLSPQAKENMAEIIKIKQETMIGPSLTLCVSSMENFYKRDIIELLKAEKEMQESFSNYVYYEEENWELEYTIIKLIIPVIKELETLGFYSHWQANRLPLIEDKILEITNYLNQFNITELINRFIDFSGKDIMLWLCSYARPHGIKICGNAFISDYTYTKEVTMRIAVHEMFHPPYKYEEVKDSIEVLGDKEWVVEAFKNQNPNFGYRTIEGFVEENIVEALGIYVGYKLEIEKDPYKYFEEHDEGSHVISPHFFKYLLETPKGVEQTFEEYFNEFVRSL